MTSDFRQRLTERLGADTPLTVEELDRLEAYFQLLARWNRTINLTALPLEPPSDAALDRLLVGPLTAARFLPDAPLQWFDFGSGGGSPAFPIKILRSQVKLTLVESKERKAAFLREVIRELGLDRADVAAERFEDVGRSRPQSALLVTVQAVKGDQALFDAVRSVLRESGRLLWFGGPAQDDELVGFRLVSRVPLPGSAAGLGLLERVFHVEQPG